MWKLDSKCKQSPIVGISIVVVVMLVVTVEVVIMRRLLDVPAFL